MKLGPQNALTWLGAFCFGIACAQAQPTAAPIKPLNSEPASVSVTRSPVERQEIRAQLTPRRYTTLSAEIGAKVSKLSVEEGGTFEAGQWLLQFDCELQKAQYQKAASELQAAEQTYKSNQRLLDLNAVGQLDLDLSQSAYNKAKAEVQAAEAVVSKCQIQAPFAGRVAEQKVREQQFVQAGQPLLDVIDDSVLELEFLVPSAWLRAIKVGQVFKVQIDETRKTYPAKITRMGARVDPVSQSIKLVGAINGRFPELMAGMSGRVFINTQPNP